MNEYTIHGGDEGKKRLEILSRTIALGTERFLEMAKLPAGINCLDLGCGGGDVTLSIAKRIGVHGHILGLDIDARKIQLAAASAEQQEIQNADFKVLDAYSLTDNSIYDLVYSRFVLSHLGKPQDILQKTWTALQPNGMLLIEDTDFSGHFSHPASRYFNQYVTLYQRLLKKRGADANIGQKLVGMLKKTGFVEIEFQIVQPAHTEGEGKLMAEITFEGISNALIEEGLLSDKAVENIQRGLVNFRKRNDSLISLPRIFQVKGRRPE